MNVKVEVEISKEAGDVADLLKAVVVDLKAGKTPSEIAMGNLAKLKEAVDGLGEIDDEAKDKVVFARTLGMKLGEIVSVFI